jgi:hypothetical protein
MKKVTIKNLAGVQTHGAQMEDPTAWIAECVASNAWGLPERIVLHKDEPGAQAYDDADVLEEIIEEVSPAVDAVMELVSEAIPAVDAVLDDQGVEISPASPAIEAVYREVSPAVAAVVIKRVKLKAEYTVEIEDITAQVAQKAVNAEALAYLASTDWKALRHIRQKALGVPTSLSDEAYLELEEERAAKAALIIR